MAKNLIALAPLPQAIKITWNKTWALLALEAGWPNKEDGLTCTMQIEKTTKHGVELYDRTIFVVGHAVQRNEFLETIVKRMGLARPRVEKVLFQMIEEVDGKLQASQELEDAPKQRDSQATRLVKLALDGGVELSHTAEGECYGTVEIDGHKETWMLKVRGFRRWLSHLYYRAFDTSPGSQALQDALETLAGKALYDGPEISVYTRLARHGDVIYLDLANATWQAIAITAQGWQVIDTPPIKFRRPRGMLPLPLPVSGGTLEDVRMFVNDISDAAWRLLASWLIAALRPEGPYPVLVIHGEEGSAKSSLLRILRSLIDPNTALLRSTPRNEHDLVIAATNGWMIALDNMSHLPNWLSDALCRLATGAGFGTRELYSNDEEALFVAQRPIALNGIEELVTRGDLLDRSILLYLQKVPDGKRRDETTFWRAFDQARPQMLGTLCTVISQALAQLPHITLAQLPRMADFALWAAAAAPACGWTADDFMATYSAVQGNAYKITLEASLIAPLVQEFVARRQQAWTGTATDLLLALEDLAHEGAQGDAQTPGRDVTRNKTWPSSGQTFSNALRRLVSPLRASGIQVDFDSRDSDKKGSRIINISQIPETPEPQAEAEEAPGKESPAPGREQKTF